MSIEAVLFDWGHTLFDTPGSAEFVVSFAADAGTSLTHAEAHLLWNDARMRSRRADEIAKGRDKSAALHRGCWMALWADLERRCPGISEPLYELFRESTGRKVKRAALTLIPYYAWANREQTSMEVWIPLTPVSP